MSPRTPITTLLLAAGLPRPSRRRSPRPEQRHVDRRLLRTVLEITWLKDANLAATNTFGLAYNIDLGNHPNDVYGPSYSEII